MPRLSRTAVVDAALDVAYRHGLDSLTIRKIATELDVSPMAIYWHVKNKDELLDAMGDRVCQDLALTVDPAAPWWQQLRTVLEDFMRALRAHPGAADIVVPRMLFSPNSREAMELALKALGEAGFSLPDATQLARHGVRVAISLITEPLFTGPLSNAVEVEPERRAHVEQEVASTMESLDPEEFPNILASAEHLGDPTSRPAFEKLGLETYIAGVRALADDRDISS
ncbi:TetR family transcriptional regulator [Rhodococcus sp. IEGM 1381]|uniref:TetR family transcriptional regulator n=1 Tax=Rhodococcus sp. IEGM 1381 TaxID=3047085 RepID=UPI0024B7AC97|nr:TetR family transcriptional regulator [Rhodococcus sp. IEGM 1381]MDI9897829.1 TetR family transcriptional regulator [Rhodococcus sp. IEGM 1381]